FAGGHRLGVGLGILRGKAGALASCLVTIVVVAGQSGAVAMIHGRGVDAVFIFPGRSRSGAMPALLMLTASAAPSSASATAAAGEFSWSCVHSPLTQVAKIYRIFKRSR